MGISPQGDLGSRTPPAAKNSGGGTYTRLNVSYSEWADCVQGQATYTPLTQEEIEQMHLWTVRHGPPNCWTGTTGNAAAMIRRLMRERLELMRALEVFRDSPS